MGPFDLFFPAVSPEDDPFFAGYVAGQRAEARVPPVPAEADEDFAELFREGFDQGRLAHD